MPLPPCCFGSLAHPFPISAKGARRVSPSSKKQGGQKGAGGAVRPRPSPAVPDSKTAANARTQHRNREGVSPVRAGGVFAASLPTLYGVDRVRSEPQVLLRTSRGGRGPSKIVVPNSAEKPLASRRHRSPHSLRRRACHLNLCGTQNAKGTPLAVSWHFRSFLLF